MKTVFNNKEVISTFAAQSQDEGRNAGSSFFFRGNVALSYGEHYPLARFVDGVVLISERNSTPTTDKLNSMLRSELASRNIEYVEVVDVLGDSTESFVNNANYLMERMQESANKAKRSRKYTDMHLADAANFERMHMTLSAIEVATVH